MGIGDVCVCACAALGVGNLVYFTWKTKKIEILIMPVIIKIVV